MIATRLASAAVIASFLVAALPAIGSADETSAQPVPSVKFQASIDRAVAQPPTSHTGSSVAVRKSGSANARQSPTGGGGGGKSTLIWTIVGTAASVGTTYYVMKEMKKQTDLALQQQQ